MTHSKIQLVHDNKEESLTAIFSKQVYLLGVKC